MNDYTDLSFLFFFGRWLDKLGLAARLNHDVVVRQTFVAGNYALLDNNLEPNPVCTLLTDNSIKLVTIYCHFSC